MTTQSVLMPSGRTIPLAYRPDVGLDWNINVGVLTEDEYGLAGRSFAGVMVDIGGYIGTVGVALAAENPELRVLVVEPLAENTAVIRESIALNGLADRVTVVEAAAGIDGSCEITYDFDHVEGEPDGYVHDNRYVGNIWDRGGACRVVEGLSLGTLLADIPRVALLKIDCEGCEWTVLRDPAIAKVDEIVGEWHGAPFLAGLAEILAATHTVEQIGGNDTNGIFRGVRR